MAGSCVAPEYGISPGADESAVAEHQQQNLAALLEGYGPSDRQRTALRDASRRRQMTSHASHLEQLAEVDPAFDPARRATARYRARLADARDDAASGGA